MKLAILIVTVVVLGLGAHGVSAEEPKPTKCEMCEMMKKKAAVTELAVQSEELDKLVTEMNGSLGSKKVEAMAAVLTRLVEQYKASQSAKAVEPKPGSEAHQH